jgi:hypothetical protein
VEEIDFEKGLRFSFLQRLQAMFCLIKLDSTNSLPVDMGTGSSAMTSPAGAGADGHAVKTKPGSAKNPLVTTTGFSEKNKAIIRRGASHLTILLAPLSAILGHV